MVIIFFSRVSRLPLDCVGYQWSKAKWSIFSFLFLFHSVLRNFLLYPPAPAALVNGALIPITYNLRRWIELIFFLLFKSNSLCSYQNICGYICPPTFFDSYMWFNLALPIIKYSCICAILLLLIDVFKLNINVCIMSIRLNSCQRSSIQSISWEKKYHSHASYLCFYYWRRSNNIRNDDDDQTRRPKWHSSITAATTNTNTTTTNIFVQISITFPSFLTIGCSLS